VQEEASAITTACEAYFVRVRRYGKERAAQDERLLGYTLDPEAHYPRKAEAWRAGYAAEAARLKRQGGRAAAALTAESR